MSKREFARNLQRYIHSLQDSAIVNLYTPQQVLAYVLTKVENEVYTTKGEEENGNKS